MKVIVIAFYLVTLSFFSQAQLKYYKGYSADSGLNNTMDAEFNKISKEIVLAHSSLLTHKTDTLGFFKLVQHFTKLDSSGNVILDKTFTIENSDILFHGVIKLMSNNYIAFGYYYNANSLLADIQGLNPCIVKFNQNGDTIWSKYYHRGYNTSNISTIKELEDKSLIFVTYERDITGFYSNGLVVTKIDSNGNEKWVKKHYYPIHSLYPTARGFDNAIVQTNDGGFLIGASVYNIDPYFKTDARILKIDSNGEYVWERSFYSTDRVYSGFSSVIKTKDNNFLFVGQYDDFYNTDPQFMNLTILVKINESGNLIWKKLLKKYTSGDVFKVVEFKNGNILLAGYGNTSNHQVNSKDKAALYCLNPLGNMLWSRQYEIPLNISHDTWDYTVFMDVEITNDNQILAIGKTGYYSSNYPYNGNYKEDIIILKSDSIGCIVDGQCAFSVIEEEINELDISIYPNPTSDFLFFKPDKLINNNLGFRMYNSFGNIVLEGKSINFNVPLDVSQLPGGVYLISILGPKGVISTHKLMINTK